MTCTVANIKRDIRIALDQNMSSTVLATLGDVDTLSLDDIIESKIEDAAEAVLMKAPLSFIGDVSTSISGLFTNNVRGNRIVGKQALQAGFLRLVSFKLPSWPHALHDVLPSSSPLYLQVQSPYGVCGTSDRPLIFIVPDTSAGNKSLEIYSPANTTEQPDISLCVTKPAIDGGNIALASMLVRPTVYYAAYLVALTIQDKDAAERLLGVCMSLLS